MSSINCKKRRVFYAWLLLLFLIGIMPAKSQSYFFDNYGIKQGLGEQKVYRILQDSKDNIWLGTANGLSRFDGKSFRNFTTRDSLAPGGVWCIIEDSQGYIWFGHLNGGVSRYNGSFFERAEFDSLNLTGDVTSISQVGDALWFTTYKNGALRATLPITDISNIKVRQFTGRDGLSDQLTGAAVIGDTSLICIANEGFLRRYNNQDKKFENYRLPHYTTYFNTICLKEDSKGNIWFGTDKGGIYKYHMSQSKMQYIDLIRCGMHSNSVTCFTEDKEGKMWVGTWDGGVAVIADSIPRIFETGNGLQATRIYDIEEDVEGNILIADQNNGLTIYKGDAFTTYSGQEIIPDPNVNAIYRDRSGDIWFGTNAGISRYSPSTGKKVIYDVRSNGFSDKIRYFREDKEGNLWIGSDNSGVIMFNMDLGKFEAQPFINTRFPRGMQVNTMEVDHRNNLWIGTAEGFIAGIINEENYIRRTMTDSITLTVVTALYNDPHGIMWIGTEPMGETPTLFKYEPTMDKFSKIASFKGLKPICMSMDNSGVLWIGTSEGLRALRNDSIISVLTTADGLLSDVINLLAIADDGSILIGTNNGLNRYFAESKRIFSYTERNGFTGIEARPNAVYKGAEGDFWFGTRNGAIRFIPQKASTDEMEPLTHILGMRVNYETREMIPGMKLSYNDRTILFDYQSICVTNPDVVRYRVKLEGADNDWQPVTEQTRVTYPSLAAGKYTFMVKAVNNQGIWNSEPVAFSFTIMPPFYRTWWFIVFVVFVILISIIGYIKIREKNLVREKMVLEEKVKERTAEVVQKSMEIEEKNRDITASIRYAERIQRAMLPPVDIFRDTFVLFMPKDIVSGDFYWMHNATDYQYIAVCDCTGHGVPGAFMSIIGHNSLNKVVREYGITKPSAILDHLNTEVLKALMQRNEETINDGMDMALIAFNRKKFTLEFAGAYNPLYVVRNGEVITYKGDRFPIGMTAIGDKKSFSNQLIDIHPGDMLYMCSDGYADQFGTEEVKKYKSGNVKKLLGEIWSLPVEEQKIRLQHETLTWRGNLAQVDDILFIGTKIPAN